ncbi:MAG: hypothetical protein HY982_01195 [Candidatus Magasanikbacteria bacterium]|nr:hypothetical protein [Candidatus Magasanikbacteria bacterium]
MIWINYYLFRLKRRWGANKRFKVVLRQKLFRELMKTYPDTPLLATRHYHRYALAAACLILFLAAGTGVYAYSSPNIAEDNPLYKIKRGVEKAELKMARSPERKAAVSLKLLKRREIEIAQPQKKDKSFENTLANYQQAAEETMAAAELVTSPALKSIYIEKAIDENLESINRLDEAAVKVKRAAVEQKKLEEILRNRSDKILERMETLREEREKHLEKQLENYEKLLEKMDEKELKLEKIFNKK